MRGLGGGGGGWGTVAPSMLSLSSSDLLCLRSFRYKYNASTNNYLLFSLLHFDLKLILDCF